MSAACFEYYLLYSWQWTVFVKTRALRSLLRFLCRGFDAFHFHLRLRMITCDMQSEHMGAKISNENQCTHYALSHLGIWRLLCFPPLKTTYAHLCVATLFMIQFQVICASDGRRACLTEIITISFWKFYHACIEARARDVELFLCIILYLKRSGDTSSPQIPLKNVIILYYISNASHN